MSQVPSARSHFINPPQAHGNIWKREIACICWLNVWTTHVWLTDRTRGHDLQGFDHEPASLLKSLKMDSKSTIHVKQSCRCAHVEYWPKSVFLSHRFWNKNIYVYNTGYRWQGSCPLCCVFKVGLKIIEFHTNDKSFEKQILIFKFFKMLIS